MAVTDAGATLAGARVLVAGATGGLGGAVCDALASGGVSIVATGRDHAALDALAQRVGSSCVGTVVADLVRPGAPEDVVARSVDAAGALDGLVIASGVVAFGAAAALDDATSIRLFTVNTLAPIRLARAALPALRLSRHPSPMAPFVLVISAVVAETPMAGMADYSASKAALSAWTRAAGRELRREGIRVIDARPPHTETGLAQHPIAGMPPRLPRGHEPAQVAQVLVDAVLDGSSEVPADRFGAARQTSP